jgi:cell wall-associated NlpC family hydrolase
MLAEIEYGYRPLAPDSRSCLARFYNLRPDLLEAGRPKQTHDPHLRLAQILGSILSAGIWLMLNLAFTRIPAAEQPAIPPPFPNTPLQAQTSRLSLARPPGRARLPATDRNQRREGGLQGWQQDKLAIIEARPPVPQSTAEEHGRSDAAPVPTAAPVATVEAPIAVAPTEVPATIAEAAPAPAPAEVFAPTVEAAPAPAPAEVLAPTVEVAPAPTPIELLAPTAEVAPAPIPTNAPELLVSNAQGSDVAAFAMQFVGAPYAWGGADPSGFDCSGFTQYIYRHFGLELPRIAVDQYSEQYGTIITDPNALQPGDLVFFVNTFEPGISHVGIYIANGDIVQAMSPGIGVATGSLWEDYWAQHYYGALRPLR